MEPDEDNVQLDLLNGGVKHREHFQTSSENSPAKITVHSASARLRAAIIVINILLLVVGRLYKLLTAIAKERQR